MTHCAESECTIRPSYQIVYHDGVPTLTESRNISRYDTIEPSYFCKRHGGEQVAWLLADESAASRRQRFNVMTRRTAALRSHHSLQGTAIEIRNKLQLLTSGAPLAYQEADGVPDPEFATAALKIVEEIERAHCHLLALLTMPVPPFGSAAAPA